MVLGGLKNAESAIYWRYLSLSSISFLFFKCEYLNFAEKMVSQIDDLLSHLVMEKDYCYYFFNDEQVNT